MRFWWRWRIIRVSALAFAAAAIGAPSALAMPAVGDGPGYSGEPTSQPSRLITDAHFRDQVATSGGGFDWTYVGVGIGGALGLVVLAGGARVVIRRSREAVPAGA